MNIQTTSGLIASLAFAGVFALATTTSTQPEHPLDGRTVTVQIRRDALGTAAAIPVPPLTERYNGAPTSLTGKLASVSSEWVVLKTKNGEHWIAKQAVLLVTAK